MSATHLAGLDVTIDDRYLRQRCAWCGAVLIDYDLQRVAVPVGQDPRPATWPHGAMVRTDGPVSTVIDDATLPADSCAHLDPEVTR